MKAFFATRYGGPEVMHVGELPTPVPRDNEVRVRVRAASVNPVDWKVRAGHMGGLTGKTFPKVYGSDFSGVIDAIGSRVVGWSVRDAVYGCVLLVFRHPGSNAEYVTVSAKRLRRKPVHLTWEQAAALPVAALTALAGLRKCGNVERQHILLNGATGGVGHFAFQIAKTRGARITAVCSGKNVDFARELGAEKVIDYTKDDLATREEKYDVIFDVLGNMPWKVALSLLNSSGRYVTTLGNPALFFQSLWQHLARGPKIAFANLQSKPADYAELETLLESGAVSPSIGATFSLDQAPLAYEALERGGTRGKIVICIST